MLFICHTIIDFLCYFCSGVCRKVILEFLICADIYQPLLPPSPSPFSLPSLPHRLFFSLFLSASCQRWQRATQALAARLVTDAAASQAKRRKGTRGKNSARSKKKRENEQEKQWRKERHGRKRRERKKDEWDNRELALPIVSKGTRRWIRPRPIITARWAVEGRGQREIEKQDSLGHFQS